MIKIVMKKEKFTSIEKIGFAVEYFPAYVNSHPQKHSVDIFLISVIFKGTGVHHMSDAVFKESGASVSITHCGEEHSIVTDSNGMEIMNIYLDLNTFIFPSLPLEIQNSLMNFIPFHNAFKNRCNRLLRVMFDNIEIIRGPLFAIEKELKEKGTGCYEVAAEYFKIFLIECGRQIMKSGIIGAAREKFNPEMERTKEYLDKNYMKPLTLEKVAKYIGLCPNYFCRVFKSYTGKTLYEYLIQKRIQAALAKLRNSNEKIFSIAYEVGFNDLSYFNRVFSKIMGSSPGKYRKKFIQRMPYGK